MKRRQSLHTLLTGAGPFVTAALAGKICLMHPAWLTRLAALLAALALVVLTRIELHHRAVSK
jgi:hypothetical protein